MIRGAYDNARAHHAMIESVYRAQVYMAMAYVVMAYTVMAYIFLAYIVMALYSYRRVMIESVYRAQVYMAKHRMTKMVKEEVRKLEMEIESGESPVAARS